MLLVTHRGRLSCRPRPVVKRRPGRETRTRAHTGLIFTHNGFRSHTTPSRPTHGDRGAHSASSAGVLGPRPRGFSLTTPTAVPAIGEQGTERHHIAPDAACGLTVRAPAFSLPREARRNKKAACVALAVALTIPRGRSFAVTAGAPSSRAVRSAASRISPPPSSVASVARPSPGSPLLRDSPHKLLALSLPCATRPHTWPSVSSPSRPRWKRAARQMVSARRLPPFSLISKARWTSSKTSIPKRRVPLWTPHSHS